MDKVATLHALDELDISYELVEHAAVYTIEEMELLELPKKGEVVKNLFLRDAKGRRHFLVVLSSDKTANLDALRIQLDSTKLSFASEERLMRLLGLQKGAVTPLGVLHDSECRVEVVVDQDLMDAPCLGVHPCDNTATVFLSWADLERLIRQNGRAVIPVIL